MSDKKSLEEQCLDGCKTTHGAPFFQIEVNGIYVCSESFKFVKQNTQNLPCKYCKLVAIEVKNHKFLPDGYYPACRYKNKRIDQDLIDGLIDRGEE